MPSFSPEFQLAIACILPQGDARSQRMERLLEAGIDWPLMLRVLERHRIAGLATTALRPYADGIPAETWQVLQQAMRRDGMENLRQAMASRSAVEALARSGVACAVLKGVTVGQLAYGSETIRHSRDIDMVILPEDIWKADDVLRGMGYRREMPEPDWSRERIQRSQLHQKHFGYFHDQHKMKLELHARLCNNRFLTPLHFDPKRVMLVKLAGCGVSLPTLPIRDLVLHLCLHGTSHSWMRLKWLADIVALLHTWSAAELQELAAYAKECRLERQLAQAVALSEALCDASLPITFPPSNRVKIATRLAVSILSAGQGADDPYSHMFNTSFIELSQFLVSHNARSLAAQVGDLATSGGYYSNHNIVAVAPKRMLEWLQKRTRQLLR
ncbi:nucleotidyltransferase family protein [Terriglobus sp. RCC_193]|uniref:nucleotidyltransferase domain-containing protein n=1 Tax=Terriglobus sp. RCC_193 TaxID=3239218 RepID=UPI003523A0F8